VFDGYRDELTIDVIDDLYGDIDTEGMFVRDDGDSATGDRRGRDDVTRTELIYE